MMEQSGSTIYIMKFSQYVILKVISNFLSMIYLIFYIFCYSSSTIFLLINIFLTFIYGNPSILISFLP